MSTFAEVVRLVCGILVFLVLALWLIKKGQE